MSEDKPIMLTSPKELEFKDKVKESAKLIQRQLLNKKWDIIKERLKLLNKLHLLKNLEKKRFKPIQIEISKEGAETVWINDGSWKGKRLVTFLPEENHEMNDNEFKGQLKYY